MAQFKVSEVFSSLQGEGPNIGKPSTFLRLAQCNLHCIFCDTAYTWRYDARFPHDNPQVYDPGYEIKERTVEDVYDDLLERNARHVVITGGEPLLQGKAVSELLYILDCDTRGWTVEFETAGTVMPGWATTLPFVSYVVSPKLENSGNEKSLRWRPHVLRKLAEANSIFKFVVANVKDFDEVDALVANLMLDNERIYIMPEGITVETIASHTADIFQAVVDRGYTLTTRLQVLAYGNKRGV